MARLVQRAPSENRRVPTFIPLDQHNKGICVQGSEEPCHKVWQYSSLFWWPNALPHKLYLQHARKLNRKGLRMIATQNGQATTPKVSSTLSSQIAHCPSMTMTFHQFLHLLLNRNEPCIGSSFLCLQLLLHQIFLKQLSTAL